MLFLLYFAIVQCKKTLSEPKPTPETYPLAVSTRQMTITNNYKCEPDDPDCTFNDLSDPNIINCGQRCWSNDGSAVFEYTFKGVQFVLYGNKSIDHGSFNLYIDDDDPEIIDEHIDSTIPEAYALLYTSDVLEYKDHKIRMEGKGSLFELFRLSYWPSLKVKRLNSTDFTSTGSWVLESDENGGTRHYTNNVGARKSISIEGSKIWVYATEYKYHGIMNVKFHTLDANINTYGPTRKDGILLYESEELPFGYYNLDISCVTPDILIYCVYYEYDPPPQTKAPFPSRSYSPETDQTYINKQFTGLTIPNTQLIVEVNSKINQISGCTFTDISEDKNYFIRLDKEIPFFDNRIEFTSIKANMPAPIWTNYIGKFTVQGCTFIKCVSRIDKGNVLTSNVATEVTFETCTFLNCGNDNVQAITKFYDPSALVKYTGCNFYFDIETLSCPAISGDSSNVIIDRCSFTKCAAINIDTQTNPANTKVFQFTNNVVTSSNQRVINVNNYLHTNPIITGNTFNKHNLDNSYFIVIRHDINEEIEFINNTFSNIKTSGNTTIYGGSAAIWVQTQNSVKGGLVFDGCKFIDNKNDWVKQPFNQGGAIQYGFTKTIANTSLKFISCEFKGNTVTNGKGGAIACSVNYDLYISNCVFENNTAGQEGGAIFIWGKIADPNTLSQISEPLQMQSITITDCQFKLNKGKNGHAVFIEKDNIEKVKLEINKCKFIDNGADLATSMIVSYCGEVLFEENNVLYSDKSKACGSLNLNVPRVLSLINDNFTNCASTSQASVALSGQTDASTTTMKKCNFIDCKASRFTVIITKGTADVEDCSISFTKNDENSACGCIQFKTKGLSCKYCKFIKGFANGSLTYDQTNAYNEPLLVTNCVFEDCGGDNTRCFNIKSNTNDITFTHNVIQRMKRPSKFGYFGLIDFYNQVENFVFENASFIDNECDSQFGGGSGLWVTKTNTLTFSNCKFVNNVALKSPDPRGKAPPEGKYYAGDGGGIQYGFSNSIYKVDMVFTSCTFTRNKAVRHGGAIALQTVQKVEIIGCTFDENEANYKPPSAELLYENYFFLKDEGRGGALYFNPAFYHKDMGGDDVNLHMTDVKVENCIFNSNSAFDGYAIYIEGEDVKTNFVIKNNRFTNNYERATNTFSRGIITSEVQLDDSVVSSNTFDPYYNSKKQYKLVYVNHSGRTPDPTPMPTIFDVEFGGTQCNPRCYYVSPDTSYPQCINITIERFENIVNDTESGGAIYIIDSGLRIANSLFSNCGSKVGGGGAIYIKNNMLVENNIIIENIEFINCWSYYGGAVYIYSISEYDNILIINCLFDSNKVLDGSSNEDGLFGGSAVYHHARNGEFLNCTFTRNKGKGGSLKIINDFDSSSSSVKLMSQVNSLHVNNCAFDDDNNGLVSSSYIDYVGGNSKSSFEVLNCVFKGNLGNGVHYIDAYQVAKDAPKVTVKACSFNDIYKEMLNFEKHSDLIGFKNLYNDKVDMKKERINLANNSYLLVVPILLVLAVFAVAFVVKKSRQYQQTSENEQEEI